MTDKQLSIVHMAIGVTAIACALISFCLGMIDITGALIVEVSPMQAFFEHFTYTVFFSGFAALFITTARRLV